ncbi:nucleolar protein dao-5-like [Triticum dicoccoides]|uniref:nucleolar protein dao-5-like n=1 Tax=Triticum dicoccoides TaxID=85692 RepID=UPI0018916742|nr:nucleolar protein dao-5-like [Triticum dicoccoides]
MEMEMQTAAADMDFNALSRRELQALCKLNGVRANMTNLAMVEALQSLAAVDGIDQIGTTLCLPTPGKSAMKSVLKAAPAAGEDQQHLGSPLPRGRRVSVKSPEAIRMEVEEGEDEVKRNLVKEIVRTPGVALRSTSRRPRATPAPLPPTPAAGTLRRSQRSIKKTEKAMEVEVSTTKRSTRKTARSKAMFDLDQEEEEEEEVTKLPEEGNSKADEPEQGDEVVSSVVPTESADKSCEDSKLEEVVEEATKLQEEAAVEEEQKLASAEKSVPLSAMEDSPILGVLSKATPELAIKNVEGASTEDGESSKWSPVFEIVDEINSASEEKEVAAVEVPKEAINEDDFSSTAEASDVPNKMIPPAVTEKEVAGDDLKEDAFNSTVEASDALNEKMTPAAVTEKEVSADDFQEDAFNSTVKASDALNEMTPAAVTEKEVAAADFKEDALHSTIKTPDAPNKMTPAAVTEKDVAADDIKENAFSSTVETADAPTKMIPAAVTEKEVAADDSPKSDLTEEESDLNGVGSEEDDLSEYSSEEDDLSEYSSEEDDLSEYSSEEDSLEEEDMQKVSDSAVVNFYSDEEEDLEDEDMQKANDSTEANFDSNEEEEDLKMPETVEEPKENEESGEEDDFSADLSSEFDDVEFSDAETESHSSQVALEAIHATPASSAAKTADSATTNMSLRKLKSALKEGLEELEAKTVDSVIIEELEESSEGSEVSQHAETIVKTLHKFTITEEKNEECAKQNVALTNMSLRKLKSALKEGLIAAKEGKNLAITADEGSRVALAELDDNAEC